MLDHVASRKRKPVGPHCAFLHVVRRAVISVRWNPNSLNNQCDYLSAHVKSVSSLQTSKNVGGREGKNKNLTTNKRKCTI
jgi:hypothetical protein